MWRCGLKFRRRPKVCCTTMISTRTPYLAFTHCSYHRGSERGQVIEEMPVLLKDWPENVWHCKDDAGVGDVGKRGPLLPLPQLGGPMPTTRTGSRFTGVVDEFLLGFRGVNLGAQSRGLRQSIILAKFSRTAVLRLGACQ